MDEHLEIERKYLLSRMPDLPTSVRCAQIRQGYFASPEAAGGWGRVREWQEGSADPIYFHTEKSGTGVVRVERERTISGAEFETLWAKTEGARLSKRRWLIPEGALVWEIDEFTDRALVLAEVELPSEEASVNFPAWLAALVVREVTEEAGFTNAALARSGPAGG